jgi:four helix bundle protein
MACVHATCVEDLQVFQRAKAFAVAVFALTSSFRSDYWLGDQLNASAESIMSNIAEGFRQATDRGFARYLSIAAGSAEETRSHLTAAELKGHLAHARAAEVRREALEITTMLGTLIRYLRRSDRKDRNV